MWVLPEEKGVEPSYEQRSFLTDAGKGKAVPVVAVNEGGSTFYVAQLEPGKPVTHALGDGRRA
jgi:hypothetical protein